MVRSKSVTFLCVTFSFPLALGACADDGAGIAARCGAIEAGGCPGNSLEGCADEACDFVATCAAASGRWVSVATCPARARDAGVGAGAGDDTGTGDAGAAGHDAGSSTGGCPPLQAPDCSEATRVACGAGCCGCEDVFRCEGGGWVDLGPCVP
jgi:hypothetical protein